MIPRIWKLRRSILIMLTVILSALVVSIPQAVRAAPSLGIDGVGRPSGCCGSQLLTTDNANDVVVLIAECGFRSCNGNVSSVTDSSGLSYTLRLSYGPNDRLWEYYAIAPAPLSSDNITVAVSGFLVGWMVFAVKGANTASAFDISPSLPATISCPGAPGRNDCTVSAQTSAADFVIASTAINDADACTPSTGFTEVTPAGGSLDVDYQIVDTLGAKTYFTCSGTDPTAIVLDALTSSNPHMPIFIDGVGTNNCQGQFCVHSQLLTTTMGSDVVILVVDCNGCSNLSVTDGRELIFTERLAYAAGDRLWEFYAIASSPLTSDNITVLPDSSDTGAVFKGMQTFALHGANMNAVFDSNPSIPATASYTRDNCGVGYGKCSVSVQTSSVDFLIGSTAIDDAGPCGQTYQHGSVPGFTNLTNQNNGFEVDYAITATPQSNVVFDCNGTDASAIVVDAISSAEHSPILINGNDGFTVDNGVTGGTGTSNDPYVISGWTIQAQSYGIEIANTTAYFTITGVTISGGGDGIVLSSIQNGVAQNSYISVYGDAVWVDNSGNFQITTDNVYSGNGHGIFLYMSSSFDVSYNTLGGGPFAITGSYVSDASIVGNSGGAEDGINLDHLSGLLISQNNIQAHTPITVYSCGDLTIDNNTVNSPDTGIGVSNCNNVLVSNNNANVGKTASNGGVVGIWVDGSDGINITSNTVSYNIGGGIRLTNFATGNTVTNNVITNNQCGIQTDSTSTVDQNYVADNSFAGNTQDYCSL